MSLTWLQDDQGTFWLLTLNLCGSRHAHLENVSNLSNLRMSLMFEICLTFTEGKAKIMLLSPNMRPFCWRHSGSIADRSAGWITISPSLSAAGSRPWWVHNGYKCLTALKWFHQAGSTEITLAGLSTMGIRLVNGFDESSPHLASNLQHNQLQSISIGETYS